MSKPLPKPLQDILNKAKKPKPPEKKTAPSEDEVEMPNFGGAGTNPFGGATKGVVQGFGDNDLTEPSEGLTGDEPLLSSDESEIEALLAEAAPAAEGNEPTLGAELGVKSFEEEQKGAPDPKAEADEEDLPDLPAATEALPDLEAQIPQNTTTTPPDEPQEQPAASSPDAGLQKELDEALDQLAEQRKVIKGLKDDVQQLAAKGGAAVPKEFWGMKNKLAEAEAKAERLQEELSRVNAQPKPQQPAPTKSKGELPDWQGKEVRVLFPCMKTTNPVTMLALIALAMDFGPDKIGFEMECGDSMIYHSRNKLADRFLKLPGEPKWSFWIDDDIIPPFGRQNLIRAYTGILPSEISDNLLNEHVLKRLMSHGKSLVGGTYFGRRAKSPAMFKEGIDNPQAYNLAKTGSGHLLETEWVATGCMLVNRQVYLDIQKKFPELAPTKTRTYWDYFRPGEDGEDVMFCKRAKAAGHQAYVDTGVQCLHVGTCAYGLHNTTVELKPSEAAAKTAEWLSKT